ncbi:MAG TPA: DUF4430 domain-containing protein [Solirubrobacterales bacterium]
MAVVGALLCAALTTAGCGLGAGADVGAVDLTVTREFGAVPVLETSVGAKESDTVMRVLEGEAEIETRYGGGFVHAIDGVAEGSRDGDPYDWFFYVDGVESQIGAAEYDLGGGERVWWDYRDWATTNHIPGVVGSWPAPFGDGIGGKRYPVAIECEGEREMCDEAREALEREGVEVASGAPGDAIRMLVGPWNRVRSDPAAALIEAGPAESGVFADFQSGVRPWDGNAGPRTKAAPAYELLALDESGKVARDLGPNAGLVAATSRYGGLPVWVVTGGTAAAVRDAARALDAEHLRDHYAVAIEGGETTPLPLEER